MEADRVIEEEDVIDVPVGVQQLFDERHYRNISRSVRKAQPKLYRAAVLCGAVILMIVYFIMPVSHVSSVTVSGNSLLSDEYVRSISGVSDSSIYYFTVPLLVKSRIEHDPLIESAEVSLERNNTIAVTVTEKKILGYRYDEEPVLLMTDGTKAELKSEYLDIISKVPLIIGFPTDEQTAKLCRAFKDVDSSLIRDVSEISQYSLSYDPQAVRVLMRSGGYFIGNYYNTSLLNKYWDIYNHQNDKSYCIFADDSLTSAYSKICPWDEPEVDKEYWKDSEGNIMTNTYGDKVEKHYYLAEDGSFALDGQGRKIPVPVTLQGFEVPDEKFHEHYEKGFYESGVLEIPEGYTEEEEENTDVPSEETEETSEEEG